MSSPVATLIARYRVLAKVCASIDYGNSLSVKRNNAAVDEMRSIGGRIGAMGESAVREFGGLLVEELDELSLSAAFAILELMDAPTSIARRAFDVIEKRATGDDVTALGCKMRLEELQKR